MESRPEFDVKGERIIYDSKGRRIYAYAQREYTPWEIIQSIVTAPKLIYNVYVWQKRGFRVDDPDFTVIRPSGDSVCPND